MAKTYDFTDYKTYKLVREKIGLMCTYSLNLKLNFNTWSSKLINYIFPEQQHLQKTEQTGQQSYLLMYLEKYPSVSAQKVLTQITELKDFPFV